LNGFRGLELDQPAGYRTAGEKSTVDRPEAPSSSGHGGTEGVLVPRLSPQDQHPVKTYLAFQSEQATDGRT